MLSVQLYTPHDGEGEYDTIKWLFEEIIGIEDMPIISSAIVDDSHGFTSMVEFYAEEEPMIGSIPLVIWHDRLGFYFKDMS